MQLLLRDGQCFLLDLDRGNAGLGDQDLIIVLRLGDAEIGHFLRQVFLGAGLAGPQGFRAFQSSFGVVAAELRLHHGGNVCHVGTRAW